jgi:protein gp37
MPRRWRKPRRVFVNSMSDLFHPNVPLSFIEDVFRVMNECPQHTFQVLTKRPEIAARGAFRFNWTPNIWMGTSVEDRSMTHRIPELEKIPAAVRFLSLEPLLGPLGNLRISRIHWVIVGGESGPDARPMKIEWVRAIRRRCIKQGVPFFFKQWGGLNKADSGRVLDERTWDEMPDGVFKGTTNVRVGTA